MIPPSEWSAEDLARAGERQRQEVQRAEAEARRLGETRYTKLQGLYAKIEVSKLFQASDILERLDNRILAARVRQVAIQQNEMLLARERRAS